MKRRKKSDARSGCASGAEYLNGGTKTLSGINGDPDDVKQSPNRGDMFVEQNKNTKREPRRPVRSRRPAEVDGGDMFPGYLRNKILKVREMKMRRLILIFVPVLLAGFILAGCGKSENGSAAKGDSTAVASSKGERKVLYWYDPMSPTIHFDHPGKSPTMDMDLVPMYADQMDNNPNVIRVDPAMVQNIGVVTAPVERRRLTRTINTYGVVVPDEKSITDINTRVSGWIERLYFDYTGMSVSKDQPMAVIYSPDMIAAEQEFLQSVSFARAEGQNGASQLVKSARERLKFFGIGDKEIDALQYTGKVIDRVVIHSPANGVILDKNVFDGQKINPGQTLFTVADLHRVWVLADVFKIDMPFLKLGSPATVAYNSSQSYEGTADFIYPEVDATARSVKVRIPLYNSGMSMKVGQYVNVAIHSPVSYDAIAVPSQAVINTGLRQVVAVALGGGRFEIRDVKLGAYADGYYEVTSGLMEGEEIVTSGQFLIDSDANLRNAGASLMTGMPGMPAQSSPSENKKQKNENDNTEKMPGMKIGKPKQGIRSQRQENMNGMDMPPKGQAGMDMSGKKDTIKSMSDSTRQEH
jgi:Cu(I)/Ag(I) efflux system membrane fusion protein